MPDLFHVFHELESYFLALAICAPRMLAFFSTALIFNQASMTRMARHGLVMVLSIPLVPMTHMQISELEVMPTTFLLIAGKEYLIGLMLGFTVGWLFWSVQAAGALIDNQRGASMAESMDPLLGHQSSPLGNLFSQAIMTYMFITGGILFVIGILYESYRLWPITNFVPVISDEFPSLFLSIMDHAMRLMLVYAAPVVVVMFLAEMSLAMISRFAPQIQVFILAMPIKSGIAILILIFYVVILMPEAAGEQGKARRFALQMFETFFERSEIEHRNPRVGPNRSEP